MNESSEDIRHESESGNPSLGDFSSNIEHERIRPVQLTMFLCITSKQNKQPALNTMKFNIRKSVER